MSNIDKRATDLLIENGVLIADTLRHLADNEIDSDYFAICHSNENGTEIECELAITDYARQAAGTVDELVNALGAAEKRIAELSGEFFALPPLNDDLVSILGRPNFTCAHLAELLRKGGQDIRRKSEHEQAAVIYWFLDLYLKYGDKWESIAKDDIQARAAMLTAAAGKGDAS